MKSIDTKVTLLVGENGVSLDIIDTASGVTFLAMSIPSEKFMQMMSRLARVDVEGVRVDLDNVGKTLEMKGLEFEIPINGATGRKILAVEEANRICPEGWEVSDLKFSSQDSFFNKGGVDMARTRIRRYV